MTAVPLALFLLFTALFGAAVGSFLNVCIFRLPREGLSVSRPRRSFCPSCGFEIAWHDNLPILSWLALGGRCRSCRSPIGVRYLLVEAGTALAFVLVAERYLLPEPASWAEAVAVSALAAGLIVVSFVDIDHRLIPDEITLGGMALAPLIVILAPGIHPVDASVSRLLASVQGGIDPLWAPAALRTGPGVVLAVAGAGALAGLAGLHGYAAYWRFAHPEAPRGLREGALGGILTGAAGAMAALGALRPELLLSPRVYAFWAALAGMIAGSTLVLVVGIAGTRVFRKPAMGFGDVKLLGLLGAFTGWSGVIAGFLIACILGSVVGLFLLARYGSRYLPFGPFLALGAFSMILWPEALGDLLRWYAGLFH